MSTKVPEEQVETIKCIVEERGTTVSALLRELLYEEIKKKEADWDAPCFGLEPRSDKPRKKEASVDEIVYGTS